MKNRILITAFSLITIGLVTASLTSCQKKKDWKCNCYMNGDLLDQTVITDQKEKDATKACDALEDNGVDCKLY